MTQTRHSPDWRWQFAGEMALWYPDCRLFRQRRPGDWAKTLRTAGDALLRASAARS